MSDLSVGRYPSPKSSELRRYRHQYDECRRVFSGWGEPIWRRGLERQRLGMDAESEESLSLPGGPARAGTATKSSGASQQSPCAAGRGVQRPPQGRAVCLSRLAQPGPPVQVPRLSGGGVPMPLILRALSLWPLGETRGVLPSGHFRATGEGSGSVRRRPRLCGTIPCSDRNQARARDKVPDKQRIPCKAGRREERRCSCQTILTPSFHRRKLSGTFSH
jgi:hypothetical protein